MVNVPQGRAISPVTKTNWEGTGVKPEVAVSAEKALDTAYLAALEKVKATIDAKKRPGMASEIDDAIAKLKSAKK
jgi:retinol-binding protein 3